MRLISNRNTTPFNSSFPKFHLSMFIVPSLPSMYPFNTVVSFARLKFHLLPTSLPPLNTCSYIRQHGQYKSQSLNY